MLSYETEAIFSKLLLSLADGEKATETARQVLASQFDFDLLTIFNYFDRENKNFVDEYNITDFLK